MKKVLREEQRKELFEKRKYYSEHPEEAKKEYAKRYDGIGLIPAEEELYVVMDDTFDCGKEPLPIEDPELKKRIDELITEFKNSIV